MGKTVEEPRTVIVSARVTAAEAAGLERKAKVSGISLSELLRLRIFGRKA